jgi:hypothetical protein
MEYRGQLELRQVPRAGRLNHHALHADRCLLPPDLSEEEEHQGRFERNRSGYYSMFVAMCLLDITQTAVHGNLFHPIWYVPFVGQYAVLAGPGLIAYRRGSDRFLAWYQLITLLVWALVVTPFLVGNTMTA